MLSKFLISPYFVFGLFLIIFFGHALGLDLEWYWAVEKLDTLHHFLGGIWISAVFFYFLNQRPNIFDIKKNFLVTLVFALGFSVLASVIWEFFEFALDQIFDGRLSMPPTQPGLEDTIYDLFFGLIGALLFGIVYLVGLKPKLKS